MLLAVKGDFPKEKDASSRADAVSWCLEITDHRITEVRVNVMPEA